MVFYACHYIVVVSVLKCSAHGMRAGGGGGKQGETLSARFLASVLCDGGGGGGGDALSSSDQAPVTSPLARTRSP